MSFASVSVIVPCYNTEPYLGAALESVCTQIPAPDEVIVVDDGSTDASASIAEQFGPTVRCYRQPHRGAGAARNAGLAVAHGTFIAFLDADDLWTPDSLACRVDVLAGDVGVDVASGLVEQFISPELSDEVQRAYVCPPGVSRARVPGTMLIRRAVIDRIGAFDETLRVGEAVDWVSRADAAGTVFRIVERVVLRRRIHGANTGAQNHHWRADYLRLLKNSLDRKRATATPGPVAPLAPESDDT